jgi:hypothetical protein
MYLTLHKWKWTCMLIAYCGSFPHERQSTDVRCYATACWFHFHGNQQYVTTQQYCNTITSGVFSWSVSTQQSVAMQQMSQLWSDQSGFQWVSINKQQWVSEWVSVNIVLSVNKVVNPHKDYYHYVGVPTYCCRMQQSAVSQSTVSCEQWV